MRFRSIEGNHWLRISPKDATRLSKGYTNKLLEGGDNPSIRQ